MVDTDTSLNINNEKDHNNLDVQKILSQPYKYGFTTNVEVEDFPKGINDNVIKLISLKKIKCSKLHWSIVSQGDYFLQ